MGWRTHRDACRKGVYLIRGLCLILAYGRQSMQTPHALLLQGTFRVVPEVPVWPNDQRTFGDRHKGRFPLSLSPNAET